MKRTQAGFTLVELMISLVLFSFAIAGVLAVAVSMSQAYREQRAAMGAESAARIPLDFITDALRQASPGAPTGNIQDANTCVIGVLKVTNNQTAAHDVTLTGWDQLDVIFASGAVVTSTRSVYAAGTTSLTVTDASQLAAGDYIVISDTGQGHIVKILTVTGNVLTLAAQCGTISLPSGGYASGSLVIRAQHAIFFIDAVDGIPTLMMNPTGDPTTNATAGEPLAEGVEDLQIAVGVDVAVVLPSCVGCVANDNTVTETGTAVDDDEWQGNFVGDSALAGTVRAVRATLIARTTSGLIGNLAPYFRPAAEDHGAATTFDNFRRRVLKSMVEIRNMGGSP